MNELNRPLAGVEADVLPGIGDVSALRTLLPATAVLDIGGAHEIIATVDRADLPAACQQLNQAGANLLTMVATDEHPHFVLRYVFSVPHTPVGIRSAVESSGGATGLPVLPTPRRTSEPVSASTAGLTPGSGGLFITVTCVLPATEPHFPSATRVVPAAHWYEREAHDMFGVVPVGHPDPRRLVLHDDWPHGYHPLRKDVDGHVAPPREATRPFPFHSVAGEGITEVPVGPIHAGIIEPGHFRFSVIGEHIVHLEARLYYVHRGIEKLCEGLAVEAALEIVERICGVCTLSHAVAYCQAAETIAGTEVPPRAIALRTALLELERLYNHIGDVGNICAGVGLAAGTMAGARLKDQLQALCERLTGSRYLRGIARPGGLRHDLSTRDVAAMRRTVEQVQQGFADLARLLFYTPSFMSRLDATGILPRQSAIDLGAVGVAARASGVGRDIRLDHPYAAYSALPPTLVVEQTGDVRARFMVRVREAYEAARLIEALLATLPEGEVFTPPGAFPEGSHALGWTKSPRGEHVHWLRTGPHGTVDRLRVRAASYCNWPVVPLAVPGNMVPDFPLINKSFELCYSCLDR